LRLGLFMMPMHPAHRHPLQTLQEDREAVILADRLGFHDAFVGEHLTDRCENITNSFVFLATLIHETRTIKLATGTANLSHSHPALLAAHNIRNWLLGWGGVVQPSPADDAEPCFSRRPRAARRAAARQSGAAGHAEARDCRIRNTALRTRRLRPYDPHIFAAKRSRVQPRRPGGGNSDLVGAILGSCLRRAS